MQGGGGLYRQTEAQACRRRTERRGILKLAASAGTDRELRQWLRGAFESGNVPIFSRTVAEAALLACIQDYMLPQVQV